MHKLTYSFLALFTVSIFVLMFGLMSPDAQAQGALQPRGELDQSTVDRDRDEDSDDIIIPILFGVSLDDLSPNFGDPRDGGDRKHEGFDIITTRGALIISPTSAKVRRIGRGSNSGIYVSTSNPGGETFAYMHLDAVADIDEGDSLEMGDLIGYVGDTGNARGGSPHLHFEIRERRSVKDPYFRITKELDLEEKIEILEEILDDVDDEDELAEFLVSEYLGEFVRARTAGIELPEEIADELPNHLENISIPTRNLTIESEGSEVRELQSILIAQGYLNITAPTGYFGPLTEEALQMYQRANSIEPASGYYGSITRAHMNRGSAVTQTASDDEVRKQLIARIAELTELTEELQSRLNAL